MTQDELQAASRDELLAENRRLKVLLAQAGIDARRQAHHQSVLDAQSHADLAESKAETTAARADVRKAHDETREAEAELATSEHLVAELKASQAQLRAVVETVPVGILLAEAPSGRIVMGNRRVEEILGHPPIYSPHTGAYDAYVGYHADGRVVQAEEWPLARIIRGDVQASLEAHYQRPDGTRIWIAVNGEAIRNDQGDTLGAVIAFRSIEGRKQAEAAQSMLNHELSHRLKNTLAMVQSIAAQTLRNAPTIDQAREALAARLIALGKAHDMLLAGHADSACVSAIARGALSLHEDGTHRFHLSGPPLFVGPSAALSLGLMLHELATNATKYGALSIAAGRVEIAWRVSEGADAEFRLTWQEHNGPPVKSPSHKGFGTRLIERGLAGAVGGTVSMDFQPAGLACTLTAPLAGFQVKD